jgi:hypothetical protein
MALLSQMIRNVAITGRTDNLTKLRDSGDITQSEFDELRARTGA